MDSYCGLGPDSLPPCQTSWQLLLREGRVHVMSHMRSQDVWLGMPYDVYQSAAIGAMVAGELSTRGVAARPGPVTHTCGSLHLYDVYARRAEEALREAGDSPTKCVLPGLLLREEAPRCLTEIEHGEAAELPADIGWRSLMLAAWNKLRVH